MKNGDEGKCKRKYDSDSGRNEKGKDRRECLSVCHEKKRMEWKKAGGRPRHK